MRQDHFDAAFLLGQMTQAQKDQARRSDSHDRRLDEHHVRITRLERRPRSVGNLRDWYPAIIGAVALALAMIGRGDLAARLLGQ